MADSILARKWNGRTIRQREDGYLCLTDMAKATGKEFKHWNESKSTKSYIAALSTVVGIPTTALIEIKQGGLSYEQGTWGHRKVAIRFAQWCSDEFAVQVDTWIEELLLTGEVKLSPPAQVESPKQEQSTPTIKDELDVISLCLSTAGLDPKLTAGVMLNHAGIRMPQLKGAIAEGHQILAASLESDLLLTPTKIGKELGVSGRRVNQILLDLGYQVKNLGKTSKTEPDYLVTEIGKPYAGNTLATGQLQEGIADNSTYQHLKWKPDVIPLVRELVA